MSVKTGLKPISKKRVCVSKKTYNEVYERDKGCCRLCNKTNIELHHVYYRSERKDLIDKPSNCIMLCFDCHKLVHSNKKKYQPLLLKLLETKKEIRL
jgi:5-methylcytosine-specific restriction endonuclease McrA